MIFDPGDTTDMRRDLTVVLSVIIEKGNEIKKLWAPCIFLNVGAPPSVTGRELDMTKLGRKSGKKNRTRLNLYKKKRVCTC